MELVETSPNVTVPLPLVFKNCPELPSEVGNVNVVDVAHSVPVILGKDNVLSAVGSTTVNVVS